MKQIWLYFFVIVAVILGAFLLYVQISSKSKTAKMSSEKPNIIFILSDDVGYSDVGAYGSEIRTPHIDRLADEGIRFANFYNMAKCEPSRSTLFTGLYEGGKNAVNFAQVLRNFRLLCNPFREGALDEVGSGTCFS